jgi:hypothetical protein
VGIVAQNIAGLIVVGIIVVSLPVSASIRVVTGFLVRASTASSTPQLNSLTGGGLTYSSPT